MTRRKSLTGLMLAGLLLLPGNLGFGGWALAQSGSGELTEPQRRQMEQKYQERWETLEQIQKRQEDSGAKLQNADQRRRDAEKRQREAERRLRERRPSQGQ